MIQESKKVSFEVSSSKLWVMNARLATKLNLILCQYLDDDKMPYVFQTGEEALFKVPQIEMDAVTRTINEFV